jgi:divalent metal cation (Fe/Co/Zn/Cd) transporter
MRVRSIALPFARAVHRSPLVAVESLRAPLVRSHSGHGHSHGNAAIGSSEDEVRRSNAVIRMGLYADTGLAALKAAVGSWTGSPALITDAVHSLADMLVSVAVMASRYVSTSPPDSNHPYGHGKVDALGALAVSTLLVGAGVSLGWHAAESVLDAMAAAVPSGTSGGASAIGDSSAGVSSVASATPAASPHHWHFLPVAGPAVGPATGLGVCVAAVVAKEAVYQWTALVAAQQRSQVRRG